MQIDSKYPLVNLPEDTQLILLLIREQLKITKFFNTLQEAGIDDCSYQPHLDTAILACMGFTDIQDELMDFYLAALEKYSTVIEPDADSITKQAMRMYEELASRKKF